MFFLGFFLFLFELFQQSLCGRVVSFDDDRGTNTGIKVLNNAATPKTFSNFTFCVDFNLKRVKYSRLLSTPGTNDLEILIPRSLDRIYTKFKGIWYLTPPKTDIEPYNFGTYCMAYDTVEHRVIFAYNGMIIFEKNDPIG